MTPDDVHGATFQKSPFGHRGYDEQAVDELLDRLEVSFSGRPQITLPELAEVTLPKPPIGRRGYHKMDVDAFIQRAISEWPTDPSVPNGSGDQLAG